MSRFIVVTRLDSMNKKEQGYCVIPVDQIDDIRYDGVNTVIQRKVGTDVHSKDTIVKIIKALKRLDDVRVEMVDENDNGKVTV